MNQIVKPTAGSIPYSFRPLSQNPATVAEFPWQGSQPTCLIARMRRLRRKRSGAVAREAGEIIGLSSTFTELIAWCGGIILLCFTAWQQMCA